MECWIDDRTDIVCPYCGQHYDYEILFMAHGDDFMYYCPKCGKPVDLESYYNDTQRGD